MASRRVRKEPNKTQDATNLRVGRSRPGSVSSPLAFDDQSERQPTASPHAKAQIAFASVPS